MANDVRERLADDGGCCAHLTVNWTTEELPSGFTRGWWECQTCQTHFWPKQERGYGVLPCGCIVGLVDDVFAIKSVCPNHVAQEPPTASEGCGSVTYGYRPCILCGHETSLVCGKCKLPICAKPEHDDQCLHQELIAAAEKARKLAAAVSAYIDCNDETNINRLLAALKEVENG